MFSKKLYGNFFYDLFSRTHSKYTVMFFIYLVLLKFLRIHVISFFSGFLEKTLFRVKCWLWLSRCSQLYFSLKYRQELTVIPGWKYFATSCWLISWVSDNKIFCFCVEKIYICTCINVTLWIFSGHFLNLRWLCEVSYVPLLIIGSHAGRKWGVLNPHFQWSNKFSGHLLTWH